MDSYGFEIFCYAEEYLQTVKLLDNVTMLLKVERSKALDKDIEGARPEMLSSLMKRRSYITPGSISRHVLLSLSLEIFLKCLHSIRGNEIPRGHSCKNLFEKLSSEDQNMIETEYLTMVEPRYTILNHVTNEYHPPSLNSVLEKAKYYFVDLRCGYERPSPRSPSHGGSRGNLGIYQAVLTVRKVILSAHNDWDRQFEERNTLL